MEKLKNFLSRFGWLIVAVILTTLFVYILIKKENTHRREVLLIENAYKTKIDMQSHNMALLAREKDSLKGELLIQRQLNLDLQTAYDLELIEVNSLKNELAQVSTTTEITDTVFITYNDTIVLPDKNTIRVPKKFSGVTEWYSYQGIIQKEGVLLTPKVFNKQIITIGEARQDGVFSFLKQKVPVIEVQNRNPYATTIDMSNIIIVERPARWYETRFFQITAGFGAGFILGLIAN